jgi:glutathione S-transferase
MLTLYIANKNDSSWSKRPWVLLKQLEIPFTEVKLRFDPFDLPVAQSQFKQALAKVSPAGQVPVLVDDGFSVWDTLAIVEYVAERFPERNVWPREVRARARARSVCAEMHAGFSSLRRHCTMNIEASLAQAGALAWRDHAGVRRDVQRLVAMWSELLQQHGGPMLFGEFGIAACATTPFRCPVSSPTTSNACAPCRGCRPGSRMRWPSRISWTSTNRTELRDEPGAAPAQAFRSRDERDGHAL